MIHKNDYGFVSVDPKEKLLFKGISEIETKKFLSQVFSKKVKFICIGDDLDYSKNIQKEINKMDQFFQTLFNEPSSFELPPDKLNTNLYIY